MLLEGYGALRFTPARTALASLMTLTLRAYLQNRKYSYNAAINVCFNKKIIIYPGTGGE
jgi:hypothetical protein